MGRKITLKKVLYHPLAWIAIGLHVLLLGVPLGNGAPTDEVAAEPEDSAEEAVPVDILNLSEITSSTPPAKQPPNANSPKSAAAPSSAPRTVIPQTATSAPAPASNSVPVSASGSTEASFEPAEGSVIDAGADAGLEPAPPAFDPAQVQGVFLSNLGSLQLEDYTDEQGLPPAQFFRKPENAAYFPHETAPTMPGVVNARWLNKSNDVLLNELQTNYAPSGVQFTRLEDYGGEELYELTTPEGQPFLYVSIVRLKGSSLMVTWAQPPV